MAKPKNAKQCQNVRGAHFFIVVAFLGFAICPVSYLFAYLGCVFRIVLHFGRFAICLTCLGRCIYKLSGSLGG